MAITNSVQSRTETSITISWTSSETIDYIQYTLSVGSTVETRTYNTPDGKSGSFTASNLLPGSSYTIVARYRNKTTQEYTAGSTITASTYALPYPQTPPDFSIGNTVTFGIYNPLFRSVTIRMYVGATQIFSDTTTAQTYSWTPTASQITTLYTLIPESTTGSYQIRIIYSGNTETANGTYKGKASVLKAKVTTFTAIDTDATSVSVTGDSQVMVQTISVPQYTASITPGTGTTVQSVTLADARNTYAMTEITSGVWQVSGAPPTLAPEESINITVIDKRGYETVIKKILDVTAYTKPTVSIDLKRENNFYAATTMKVTASYAHIGSNAATMTYKYRKKGDSTWTNGGSITSGTTYNLTFDNQYAWQIRVTITDSFGVTINYTKTLPAGQPLIFFDEKQASVGINCIPTLANNAQLNGNRILTAADFALTQITPDEVAVTAVSNLTLHVYRSGDSVYVNLELTLSAAQSNWTTIATGMPLPPFDYIDTANNFDSTVRRNLRVRVDTSGNLEIRYGYATTYRAGFVYPTNYIQ